MPAPASAMLTGSGVVVTSRRSDRARAVVACCGVILSNFSPSGLMSAKLAGTLRTPAGIRGV